MKPAIHKRVPVLRAVRDGPGLLHDQTCPPSSAGMVPGMLGVHTGPRHYAVYPNVFLAQQQSQRLRKRVDCTLGSGIINENGNTGKDPQ